MNQRYINNKTFSRIVKLYEVKGVASLYDNTKKKIRTHTATAALSFYLIIL